MDNVPSASNAHCVDRVRKAQAYPVQQHHNVCVICRRSLGMGFFPTCNSLIRPQPLAYLLTQLRQLRRPHNGARNFRYPETHRRRVAIGALAAICLLALCGTPRFIFQTQETAWLRSPVATLGIMPTERRLLVCRVLLVLSFWPLLHLQARI